MLRLRASSIVLTHEEVNRAIEMSLPAAAESLPGGSSLPWDHNITIRRQKRKGKQREDRDSSSERALVRHFQSFSLQAEDEGYIAGTEEDFIEEEDGYTSDSVVDGESPPSIAAESIIHDAEGWAEEAGRQTSIGRPRSWIPSILIDGPASRDDNDGPGWDVYEDPEDYGDLEAYDLDYQADAEADTLAVTGDSDEFSNSENETPQRPLKPRNLDGASDPVPDQGSPSYRASPGRVARIRTPRFRRRTSGSPSHGVNSPQAHPSARQSSSPLGTLPNPPSRGSLPSAGLIDWERDASEIDGSEYSVGRGLSPDGTTLNEPGDLESRNPSSHGTVVRLHGPRPSGSWLGSSQRSSDGPVFGNLAVSPERPEILATPREQREVEAAKRLIR